MPITASAGSLSYSRLSLGDSNLTYWFSSFKNITPNSRTQVQTLYLDNSNTTIYVQGRIGSDNTLISLSGWVAPKINYNYYYPNSGANFINSYAGNLTYNSSIDRFVVPTTQWQQYPLTYPYRWAPRRNITLIVPLTGQITNSDSGFVYQTVPPSADFYTANDPKIVYNSNNYPAIILNEKYSDGVPYYGLALNTSPPKYLAYNNTVSSLNLIKELVIDNNDNMITAGNFRRGSNANQNYSTVNIYKNSPISSNSAQLPLLANIGLEITNVSLSATSLTLDNTNSNTIITFNANTTGHLVKLDSNLDIIWQKQFLTTPLYDNYIDSNNNIFVSGTTGNNVFIAKLDSNGNVNFQRQFSSTGFVMYGDQIAIDSDNNIIVAGDTNSSQYEFFVFRVPGDGNIPGNGNYSLISNTSSITLSYSNVSKTISNSSLTTFNVSTSSISLLNFGTVIGSTNINYSRQNVSANNIRQPLA